MTEIEETIKSLKEMFPKGLCEVNEYKMAQVAINALEKQIPKKPIEKVMPYSEEVGFNSEWNCPCCESYIGYFAEGMSEPEQMEYCNNCGQHIEKDWSDTD